jgi:hypothetical protein
VPSYLTTHHQLFGPAEQGAQVESFGASYVWMSPAASANQKEFYFNYPAPRIVWAAWTVIWFPTSTAHKARLVYHYYPAGGGVVGPTQMAEVVATPTGGPVPNGAEVTAQFEALRAAGPGPAYVTHEFAGDGTPLAIYESRLTLIHEIPN